MNLFAGVINPYEIYANRKSGHMHFNKIFEKCGFISGKQLVIHRDINNKNIIFFRIARPNEIGLQIYKTNSKSKPISIRSKQLFTALNIKKQLTIHDIEKGFKIYGLPDIWDGLAGFKFDLSEVINGQK